ncbi:MAG: murein biosynthesis integral membrane protein MurJ [Pseudomonadota bacterium]
MKLFNAMATIAGFTMLSRIAGMVRDMLTASILGAGPMADAFFIALKLPNFFRRIAAEGAFSVSFVPLYSKTLEQDGEEEAAKFSGQVCSLLMIVLSLFTCIMLLIMPWVIHVIAPGFVEGTERYQLAVTMTRFSFPYLMFMSLTALCGGMLNAHHRFAPFAAAPILFNLTLIASILLFVPFFPSAGHAMAVGVSVSGVLQLAMMVYFLRRNRVSFSWQYPQMTDKIKRLFKLMLPGALSAGIFQVNLFVDMMVASLLPAGAISYLYYADRLNQLPLSIAGIAVGTALLPMLSKAIAAKDHIDANDLFNRAIEFCFFVALPSAVALLIVPYPMVATLFEHGKFSASDAQTTSYVLMGAGLGLPAYIASKVFLTAFWAHEDTVTPVKITIITALTNVFLCLLLIGWLGVAGISLATGIVGWLQVYLLHHKLKHIETLTFDARLQANFPKMAICSCVMGIVLFILSYVLQPFFHGALVVKITALVALLGVASLTYVLAIHVSGVLKFNQITLYLKRSKD